MAAEVIAGAGSAVQVTVYDAMPSVGRKFLLAGKGGLNLTHSESFEPFVSRYGQASTRLEPLLADFGAHQLRDWAQSLGVTTFVGSSGRVFPASMKAAPLLRAWLHRLRGSGVRFCMRYRWVGWSASDALMFDTPSGQTCIQADAVVLALGGGSWARLGSDGAWVPLLAARGVDVAPLLPSNCGFDVAEWTPYFTAKFAGQ
ncbi:MAG: TIGR03862 family flavoprotein, partial [Polaromonas sp.]|nr:TIGR03862 family flavoprotein [Polaromonas sp.]